MRLAMKEQMVGREGELFRFSFTVNKSFREQPNHPLMFHLLLDYFANHDSSKRQKIINSMSYLQLYRAVGN